MKPVAVAIWSARSAFAVGLVTDRLTEPVECQCVTSTVFFVLPFSLGVYTQGDSDVISSYHIYANCFSAML